MKITFILKQFGTMVPPEFVTDVEVTRDDNILFIATPEGWIRIDLLDKSYAVGAYEG